MVRVSVTLLGGAPGAGKSTLLLQIADAIGDVLYVASEEDLSEIKLRADRLQLNRRNRIRMVAAMGGVPDLVGIMVKHKPRAIILDSLQGFTGEGGAGAVELLGLLKKNTALLKAPTIVISHITKDDDYAGLMTLQHAVDTCLMFAAVGEEGSDIRQLEVIKNRHGKAFITQEYEMTEHGLFLRIREGEDDEKEAEEIDAEEEPDSSDFSDVLDELEEEGRA